MSFYTFHLPCTVTRVVSFYAPDEDEAWEVLTEQAFEQTDFIPGTERFDFNQAELAKTMDEGEHDDYRPSEDPIEYDEAYNVVEAELPECF